MKNHGQLPDHAAPVPKGQWRLAGGKSAQPREHPATKQFPPRTGRRNDVVRSVCRHRKAVSGSSMKNMKNKTLRLFVQKWYKLIVADYEPRDGYEIARRIVLW